MSSTAGTFLPENSPGSGKPADKRVEQGAASREEILDAAQRLMGGRGYDGTSIAHISRESGLPNSSIYWHFNSKAGIVAAVMERGADRFFTAVGPTDPEPGRDPADYIHHYVLMALKVAVAHPDFWRLFVLLLLSNDNPDVVPIVQQVRERARTRLRGILESAYADAGAAAATRVADGLTDYMLAAFDGAFLAFQAGSPPVPETFAGQLARSLAVLADEIIDTR